MSLMIEAITGCILFSAKLQIIYIMEAIYGNVETVQNKSSMDYTLFSLIVLDRISSISICTTKMIMFHDFSQLFRRSNQVLLYDTFREMI